MLFDKIQSNINESIYYLNEFNRTRNKFCEFLDKNISALRADLNIEDLNPGEHLLIEKNSLLLKRLVDTDFNDHYKLLTSFYNTFYKLYINDRYHDNSKEYIYNSMILLQGYAQQLSDIRNTLSDLTFYSNASCSDMSDDDYKLNVLRDSLYMCIQQYTETTECMKKLINYLSEPIESPPRL